MPALMRTAMRSISWHTLLMQVTHALAVANSYTIWLQIRTKTVEWNRLQTELM